MSQDLLSGHLQQVVPLDAARALYNVYEILLDNDCTESVELINETLLLEKSTEETFTQVLTLLTDGVDDALMQFGVYMTDEASLYLKAEMIPALNQRLSDWSDTESILSILDNDDLDTREQLSELLGLMTEYSTEEYLDVIETVSDDLLVRLKQITPETPDLPEPIPMACITRSRLFYHRNPGSAELFKRLVTEGMHLGKTFPEYLDILDGIMIDEPATTKVDNLLVAALASNLSNEEITENVINAMSLLEFNLDEITQARKRVSDYMQLPQNETFSINGDRSEPEVDDES